MASKGLGKVRGLTRPGSKIVPAGDGAPAPAGAAAPEPKRGDALVGCSVRRTGNEHDESEYGSITHYIAATDTYRVGSLAMCWRASADSASVISRAYRDSKLEGKANRAGEWAGQVQRR